MGFLTFIGACSSEAGVEQVSYTVIEKQGAIELREYKPYVVAQTRIEGDFNEVGNKAFNRLFGYISGKNRSKQSIAMTAPVHQQAASQKIAMTAPVGQQKTPDAWIVTFAMPAEFTLETLPEPQDSSVELKQIPGHLAAAITYSGSWDEKTYESHKTKLENYIVESGWKTDGEPIFARYNSPFTLSFFRRNEVIIPVTGFYGFSIDDIDGKPVRMSEFKGKIVLLVNVASRCGFTPQYEGLQKLYETYKDRGFSVLAFPANNFGGQEPGTSAEIKAFCTSNYNVSFPIFSKISVTGQDIHPLYGYLTSVKTNPRFPGKITWNFNKFLIGKHGEILGRFDSKVKPDDPELIRTIEDSLK